MCNQYLYDAWELHFHVDKVNGLRSTIFIMDHAMVNHEMQITKIAITVAVVIVLFEVLPEKSVWSIPVRQPADQHVIAVPGSGGFSSLLMQRQDAYKTLTKEQERFWKRILIVDDDLEPK
jgi:hypothetical protein